MYGPFGNMFPYADMHQLNLDWIIQIAKDFLDQYTHIQEIISDGETSLSNTITDGLQQLQDKADTLTGLLDAWYNDHSEDIAGQLTQAVADFADSAETIGQTVIDSIPEDYTALSASVTNLYNTCTSATRNKWTDGDQSFTKNKTIEGLNLAAGTYTLSATITNTPTPPSQARFYAFYYDSGSTSGIINATGQRESVTVTFDRKVTKIRLDAATTNAASEGVVSAWENIQIESGSTMTDYIQPITAVDRMAREDISQLQEDLVDMENSWDSEALGMMKKLTMSDGSTLFAAPDGQLYWGGWAAPAWFTENVPNISNIRNVAHFMSLGSGVYTRGVLAIQRTPVALGVFTQEDGESAVQAGTAKLCPWKKSIVFFGDSIMWGRDGNEGTVTQVARPIPTYCGMALGVRAINKGVGSQGWISEGGGRNALEELQNYSNLANEDVIVLCWGVNDLHDYNVGDWENPDEGTIMYQVHACVDYIYTVNTTATVIIVAPWNSPSYGTAPKYKYGTTKWQNFDTALKNYCDNWGIPYFSQADSPLNGKNMLAFFSTETNDQVHPMQKGYEKLGNWLAAKLDTVI